MLVKKSFEPKEELVVLKEFVWTFNKKFSNFLSKAPILASFSMENFGVVVKNLFSEESQSFIFDHSKDVKENIRIIKEWLIDHWYPLLTQEKFFTEEYSSDELETLMSELDIEPEQAVLMKKTRMESINYKLIRVIIKKDEVFLTNTSSHKTYHYRMTMPVTLFLKKLREQWTPKHGWDIFHKKAVFLNEVIQKPNSSEENI